MTVSPEADRREHDAARRAREERRAALFVPSADDTQQEDAWSERRKRLSGMRPRGASRIDPVRDALEQRYREENQWEALVELYLGRLERTEPPPERAEILKSVAEVFAHELDDPEQAADALLEALAIDPNDAYAREELEHVARVAGLWTLVTKTVNAKLEAEKDDRRALRFAEMLARWHRIELDNPTAAEPYIARVRALDPGNPLVHKRLASQYREAGVWDAQRDALEKVLVTSTLPVDHKLAHLTLAELYDQRLGDPQKAYEHYERALALDASSMPALQGMERICRTREQFGKLAEVLDKQIDAATSDEDRISALMRLADVHEQLFVKPAQAASKLEVVLAFDPIHEGALDGLERCYRAMRAWPELVKTLERRAAVSMNPLERCDCLMKVAAVHEDKLSDADAAMEAYSRVVALDDGHEQALVELARLSEKRKSWRQAAEYRTRIAELRTDVRAKAMVHAQIAEMLAEQDRELGEARLHYEKAVALDPRIVSAWEGLQKLATRSGDAMFTVFCLERRAEHAESPRLKGLLLTELAQLREKLGDNRGAVATWEYAARTDPANEVAARAVIGEYVRLERWQDAQPACDLLLNAATRDGDGDRVFELLRLQARVATALGNKERALMAAIAALEARQDDRAARLDVLDAAWRSRKDAHARARTRTIIDAIAADSSSLSPGALVKLAEIRREGGDDERAVALLLQAIAIDSEHKRALWSLADLYAQRGEWGRACGCKQRLARAAETSDEQYALLLEAAELWQKKANNLPKAAHLLEEALAAKPGDVAVLHKLVGVYGQLCLWEKLLGTLRALEQQEADPARRAKTLFAMAQVASDKLGDGAHAAELFEEVLDLDDSRLEAFEKIVRIHTEVRDWEGLRATYARMIDRVREDGDNTLKHALYHQLGLVYRDRLGNAAHALDAFRAALKLRPDSEEDRKIVLELLIVMDHLDVAIATARAAQKRTPTNANVYRDLYELFLRSRAVDKAWSASSVLCHLGAADDEQRRFCTDYPPYEVGHVPGTLAPAAWSTHLVHKEMDARLTAIFRIVAPTILKMRYAAIPHAERTKFLGAPLKAETSPTAARLMAIVQNATEILGLAMPDLYDRNAMAVPLAIAPAPVPALFVSLDAAAALPDELLPFLVARRLAELRPELTAHALFPTVGELKSLLKAAVRAALAGPNGAGAKPQEMALAKALEKRELENLREAVSTVIGNAQHLDIRRWVQLADVTMSRAGLLLIGDVDTAWRGLQKETRSPGDLALSESRAELLAFAVSDEHADLRGAIGVGVEGIEG